MPGYSFEHILTREAAYSALLQHNRRLLHSLAADELAGRLVNGTAEEWSILPPLVSHLAEAGRFLEAHERACRMLKLNADLMRQAGYSQWLARATELWQRAYPERPLGADGLPDSVLLLLAVNEFHWRQGNYPVSGSLVRRALGLAEAEGDARRISGCMSALAVLAHDQGRLEEAEDWHRRAFGLLESEGLADDRARAFTTMNLGILLDDRKQLHDALEHYRLAQTLFAGLGDKRGLSYALNNIGCLLTDLERFDEALAHFEQGIALCRELGDRRGEGQIIASIAIICSERGRHSEAIEMGGRALLAAQELGDRRGEAYALDSLGSFLKAAGDLGGARARFESALLIRREIGDQQGEAQVLAHIAELDEAKRRTSGS